MYSYLIDSIFAHIYADRSRFEMAAIIERMLPSAKPGKTITTVHNYINYYDFIIRKGAIASYAGELMVIPFNMEDGLLICEGKSNKAWNCSAPHGAGRLLARNAAKKLLDVEAAKASLKEKGVFASVVPVDETKGAYKSAEIIEQAVQPTASVVTRVRPVFNIKAK